MFRKMIVSVFALVLITFLSACGGGIKSAQPAALNTPAGDMLTIASTNAFTDQFNSYHVVGTVLNKGSSTLTAIELSVEIKDASGNSLLKDDSGTTVPRKVFAPMLDTLAQGEASPFDFSYDIAGGAPASYTVTVAGYQSGQADRAALKVENVQLVDDAKGTLYLSGKLINSSGQWARVNSLAGYVVGNAENPLAAGSSFAYVNLLAPAGDAEERDRTPFVISIPNPAAGQDWSSTWRISWDADLADTPADHPMAVNFTNSYFDQESAYHIVGYVTNNSGVVLSPELVAGLFDDNGTVLDAASVFYSVAVGPGKTLPFDMSYFGSINSNPAEAARVRTFTVQVDPARTTTPTAGTVDLEAMGEQVQKNGAVWTFSGTVTNSTDKNLAGAMVTVAVNDGQNNLVATSSNYILPRTGAINPGETIPYKITLSLDPTVNSSGFQTVTTVVGDLTQ